jgi:hypothetical protein
MSCICFGKIDLRKKLTAIKIASRRSTTTKLIPNIPVRVCWWGTSFEEDPQMKKSQCQTEHDSSRF